MGATLERACGSQLGRAWSLQHSRQGLSPPPPTCLPRPSAQHSARRLRLLNCRQASGGAQSCRVTDSGLGLSPSAAWAACCMARATRQLGGSSASNAQARSEAPWVWVGGAARALPLAARVDHSFAGRSFPSAAISPVPGSRVEFTARWPAQYHSSQDSFSRAGKQRKAGQRSIKAARIHSVEQASNGRRAPSRRRGSRRVGRRSLQRRRRRAAGRGAARAQHAGHARERVPPRVPLAAYRHLQVQFLDRGRRRLAQRLWKAQSEEGGGQGQAAQQAERGGRQGRGAGVSRRIRAAHLKPPARHTSLPPPHTHTPKQLTSTRSGTKLLPSVNWRDAKSGVRAAPARAMTLAAPRPCSRTAEGKSSEVWR